MAEEFGYEVRFECNSEEAIQLVKEVGKRLDDGNAHEIESLVNNSGIGISTEETRKLTEMAYYGENVAKAIADFSDPCHAQLGVEGDTGLLYLSALKPDSEGVYKICAEGTDREADDFCNSFTMFLHLIGCKKIDGWASGAGWEAKWSNSGGDLVMELEEEEY